MLAEHQHMSFMFDVAFEDIFKYINRVIRSEELIKKFTAKKIYTDYYYDSNEFCCKSETPFIESSEKYPIYLYFTPNVQNNVILSAEENSGQNEIIIHVNLSAVISLRMKYNFAANDDSFLYDIQKGDKQFKEEMLGHISHEFVHIRQMFCGIDYDREMNKKTHITKNPIERQLDNKEKYTRAIQNIPGITEDCREMIYRCFYLFTKTELDARKDASTKHFNNKEKIQKLLNDFKEEINLKNIKKQDSFGRNILDFCIRKTYMFNDLDDMEFCLDYMRKHNYAYHLLKEIDKNEHLNFFKYGLEYSLKKYKARLYKSFYKLLKTYDINISGNGVVLEAFVNINGDDIFFKMTNEYGEYLGEEICN